MTEAPVEPVPNPEGGITLSFAAELIAAAEPISFPTDLLPPSPPHLSEPPGAMPAGYTTATGLPIPIDGEPLTPFSAAPETIPDPHPADPTIGVVEVGEGVFAAIGPVIPHESEVVISGLEDSPDRGLQFPSSHVSGVAEDAAPVVLNVFSELDPNTATPPLRVFSEADTAAPPPDAQPLVDPDPADEPTHLSPSTIDAVLADFRLWLEQLRDIDEPAEVESDAVDWFTLVGQFTALRHEVNMQTKAVRSAVDVNAETLRLLAAASRKADAPTADGQADEGLRPLIKAVVDIVDVLAMSVRQIDKLREVIDPLLAEFEAAVSDVRPQPLAQEPPIATASTPAAPKRRQGWFAQLFGMGPVGSDTGPTPGMSLHQGSSAAPAAPSSEPVVADGKKRADVVVKLRQLAAAAADGYSLSLRRLERLLPTFQLERMDCVGEPFEPDLMEVVEVVDAPESGSGIVLEDVRSGYLWRGKVLRHSQVKVSR